MAVLDYIFQSTLISNFCNSYRRSSFNLSSCSKYLSCSSYIPFYSLYKLSNRNELFYKLKLHYYAMNKASIEDSFVGSSIWVIRVEFKSFSNYSSNSDNSIRLIYILIIIIFMYSISLIKFLSNHK